MLGLDANVTGTEKCSRRNVDLRLKAFVGVDSVAILLIYCEHFRTARIVHVML